MPNSGREVNLSEQIDIGLEESTPENEEELGQEEKETPSESSPDEKPEAAVPDTETPDEESGESPQGVDGQGDESDGSDEPSPVVGETPRERGLRRTVEELRSRLREKRTQGIMAGASSIPGETAQQKTARLEKLKEKYSEEDLNSLQEVFTAFAEDLGFARKDELQKTSYTQTLSTLVDSFVEAHPEYAPENDKDDVYWKQFEQEVKRYVQPSNPQEYKKIFEEVHVKIFGIQPSSNLKKVATQQAKIKSASHSATPRSQPSKPKQSVVPPSVDPATARAHLHGFTEEDLKEMGL